MEIITGNEMVSLIWLFFFSTLEYPLEDIGTIVTGMLLTFNCFAGQEVWLQGTVHVKI